METHTDADAIWWGLGYCCERLTLLFLFGVHVGPFQLNSLRLQSVPQGYVTS